MVEIARAGRAAGQSATAQIHRADRQRRHAVSRWGWLPSNQPVWLNSETYVQKIQPRLAEITNSVVASVLGVSLYYAADIRRGRRRPHPRHWQALAGLVGLLENL